MEMIEIKYNIEHLKRHITIVNNQILNLNNLIDKLKLKIKHFESKNKLNNIKTYKDSESLKYKEMLERTEKNLNVALKDMKNTIERLKIEQQKLKIHQKKKNIKKQSLMEKSKVIRHKKEGTLEKLNINELNNIVLTSESFLNLITQTSTKLKKEILKYGEMYTLYKQKWEKLQYE